MLARRTRDGLISRRSAEETFELFTLEASTYTIVDLTRALVLHAASLLQQPDPRPRLRSLDALHVASAREVFGRALRRGVDVGAFVSADRALIDIAGSAGLTTANPEFYG